MGANNLSEKLLSKETRTEKIPAPAPAPARENEEEDVCGVPFDSYLGLLLLTLIAAFLTAGSLFTCAAELNDSGYASAKKVLSLLPAFYYLAGATSAVSYLAVTLHCILPWVAYYLFVLNIILLLALAVFFVGSLVFMHYVFIYIFGAISAVAILCGAIAISERRQKEKEALQHSRRARVRII